MNLFDKNKTLKPYIVVEDPYGCWSIIKLESHSATTSKAWSEREAKQYRARGLMYEKAEEIKQNYIEKHMNPSGRREKTKSSK